MARIRSLAVIGILALAAKAHGETTTTIPSTQSTTQAALIDLGFGYTRNDAFVWFKGKRLDGTGKHDVDRFAQAVGHPLKLAEAIDAASFVALNEQYTKDKHKVYYKWITPGRFWIVELDGADPATFEALDHQLARDRNTVWRSDRPFAGADPATVEVVQPNFVWKDKDSVFYQAKKIDGADPQSFEHIGGTFYRDANSIYWCGQRVPDADRNSFEVLAEDSPHGRDTRHVWCGNSVLEGVNPQTYRSIYRSVFLDAKAVYASDGVPVPDADAATFHFVRRLGPADEAPQVVRPALLRDAKRHYMYEPNFSEVYALERVGDEWIVSKPIRDVNLATGARINSGTVTARLKDGSLLGEPIVQQSEPHKTNDIAEAEVGRIKMFLPDLTHAVRAIEDR